MRAFVLALVAVVTALMPLHPTNAATCEAGAAFMGPIAVEVQCAEPGSQTGGVDTPVGATDGGSPYLAYRWQSPCDDEERQGALCGAAQLCDNPQQTVWELFGRLRDQGWVFIRSQCFGGQPEVFVPPAVTPGMVLSELRRVGLPALEIEIQPETKTLVNFDTIFYTSPRPVDVDLTILGQAVQVRATPTSYGWQFGDGATRTTSTPGAAYPSKEIVYRYLDADVTVQPSVSVTYGAQFRVGGGAWQDVGGTVTIPGPPEGLRVVEAVGVLSGEHD